jgi:ribokinase
MASQTPGHANVVVVGSANIDLVVTAPRIPAPGETVLGDEFRIVHGGKGANQAVAAARLRESVALVGRVGDDDFGRSLWTSLQDAGVDCTRLTPTPRTASGVALIVVSRGGENAICVAIGANGRLTPEDIDAARDVIARASVCVVQLEGPLPAVLRAMEVARAHGVETILDPAPAPATAPAELFTADILSPNESEAARLLGEGWSKAEPARTSESIPQRGAPAARERESLPQRGVLTAQALRQRGARAVVLKLGAAGALIADEAGIATCPARPVIVVDTTGAGDAFTAALAVGRARGMDLPQAARFAVAAGSLACTRFGAQPSMPRLEEVESFLAG